MCHWRAPSHRTLLSCSGLLVVRETAPFAQRLQPRGPGSGCHYSGCSMDRRACSCQRDASRHCELVPTGVCLPCPDASSSRLLPRRRPPPLLRRPARHSLVLHRGRSGPSAGTGRDERASPALGSRGWCLTADLTGLGSSDSAAASSSSSLTPIALRTDPATGESSGETTNHANMVQNTCRYRIKLVYLHHLFWRWRATHV